MSDVFVSYKAEDRFWIGPLVDALKADGLSVWWDAHLRGGDKWRQTITRELDEARCVIVVWSKRSTGSDGHFVQDEATRALRRGVYLPVRIEKIDPPLGFGESQAASLIGWRGDRSDPRYAGLLAAARNIIGLEPLAIKQPAPARGVDRRAMLAGGAVLVAAAAGGGWYLLKGDSVKSDSIAVLPFANLSGDPAQAYFSDGMAEELRNALSRIARLKVVARTSSEMLRDADAKTAARKLDVANILTGSVRRSASTIRVAAQLVDGRNGMELWSQSFDRPFGDVLQIQTDIATSVAEALRIRLGSAERAVLSLGGTRNAAAQDLLLKAAPKRNDDTRAGLLRALALIDAAIALDPNYAEAYARKALALIGYAGSYTNVVAEYYAKLDDAKAAARRAIAIEPRLAAGYGALGAIYRNELNIGGAIAEFERALAQPGTDVSALGNYASLLGQVGRTDEALKMIETASRLDPLDPIVLQVHATILYQARRYQESIDIARHLLKVVPGRIRVHRTLANCLFMLGRFPEAGREYAALPPDEIYGTAGPAFLAAHRGDRATAERLRGDLVRRFGDAAHYQYAQIDAQVGNKDRAFSELEMAWKIRDPGYAGVLVDPFLNPLRSDPRFAPVVRKLNT